MSEQEKQPQKPERQKPQERFNLKLMLMWLGIIAIIAMLFAIPQQARSQIQNKKIGEVLLDVEAGKIKSLSITPDPSAGNDRYFVVRGELLPEKPAEPAVKEGEPAATEKAPEKEALPGVAAPAKKSTGIRFESSGVLVDSDLQRIREKFPDTTYPKASTSFEFIALQLGPTLLIGGLIAFFIYRFLKNAKQGAMTFGKSRAKLLGKDKERSTFKDVAGCDEAKEDIQEIVEFLRDPKKFKDIGAHIPKGVILVGPPGTGKTLLARAVAGEAEVPFYSISGSDFVEMFVGVGAARVRDLFEQARKSAPSIIFIDEIDAVGRKRGGNGGGHGGGNDEREQTLNSMLVEMDGIEGHEGLIVIAATNRVDVLDNALLRPGRFDRHVYVELPDINGREEILRVHAKKVKLAASVDLKHVARITTGYSGADLANLLNESALLAARRNKLEIDLVDIEQANDKISFGAERRKLMDEDDRKSTAYHEAGHALVQVLLGDTHMTLHKVTIIPRGRALGMAMIKPNKDIVGYSRKQLLNRICMAMAGRIGEEQLTGDYSNGAASDIKQATNIARHMVCDWGMSPLGHISLNVENPFAIGDGGSTGGYSQETARRIDAEVSLIIEAQYRRAQEFIAAHSEALRKIAEALLTYETLDAVHVTEIIRHGEIRTPVEYKPLTRQQRDEDAEATQPIEKTEAPEPGITTSPIGTSQIGTDNPTL